MHKGKKIRKFNSTKSPVFRLETDDVVDLDEVISKDRHEIRMTVIPDKHKEKTKCFECNMRGEVYISELQTNRMAICCSSLACVVHTTNYLSKPVK